MSMTTTKTDSSLSILSGSIVEGQAYARHLTNQNIQDIDILIHCGTIKSEQNLIQTGVPGFVRIVFDDAIESTGCTQFVGQNDINGIICLNGFRLKEENCSSEMTMGAPFSYVNRSGQTAADASSAAATQTLTYTTINIGKQFYEALSNIEEQRNQLNYDTVRANYVTFCKAVCDSISHYVLPLFRTSHNEAVFEERQISEQTFRDLFTLAGPAYGHRLPQVTVARIKALLDFYDIYAHVGNPKEITDAADYFQSCAPVDVDLVPSLQLKFWPKDMQPFLERIKSKRPDLYQLIQDKTSMHVISKWSTKTPPCDRELEFRYSFSAVELTLAQQRSQNQRILNGIARSIYYKFLKGQKLLTRNVIPSYFVKTTVLWMCEEMDFSTDNEETLAKKWLQYAIKKLEARYCPHYFICNLNILEPFSKECLEKAAQILSHVDIHETHQIQMFSASGQEYFRNKYNENVIYFVGRLRAVDILNVIPDYRKLKEQWSSQDHSYSNVNDDEEDIKEALAILNTLRGLDGDYGNWKTFREIFLNQTLLAPAIWGETVGSVTVSNFAESLLNIGVILTFMNEHVSTNTQLLPQGKSISLEDFQQYQNVFHQYLDPQNLYSSLQSTYSYYYNKSLSAFERRRVIDHHPLGPSGQTAEKNNLGISLVELCLTATDQQLTVRELYQQYWSQPIVEDEELALAIQRSLEDQHC